MVRNLISQSFDDDQRPRRADGLEMLGGEEGVPRMEACSDCEISDDLKSLDGSSDEEEGISGGWSQYNESRHLINSHLEVRMEVAKPSEFRNLVRHAVVLRGFDVNWKKNEGSRITVECKC